jgi:hypothetical protein
VQHLCCFGDALSFGDGTEYSELLKSVIHNY